MFRPCVIRDFTGGASSGCRTASWYGAWDRVGDSGGGGWEMIEESEGFYWGALSGDGGVDVGGWADVLGAELRCVEGLGARDILDASRFDCLRRSSVSLTDEAFGSVLRTYRHNLETNAVSFRSVQRRKSVPRVEVSHLLCISAMTGTIAIKHMIQEKTRGMME